MMLGNNVKRKNGLSVSIDWLSFTLKDSTEAKSALMLLGYSETDFVSMKKGRQGYKSALKNALYNIFILYNGNEDMGVHVDISGSAVGDVLEHYYRKRLSPTPFGEMAYEMDCLDEKTIYTVTCDLLREIRGSGGSLTRLDLAVDDYGAKYFGTGDLYEYLDAGMFSMLFKSFRLEKGRSCNGSVIGETIYIGTRQSSCFLRVYDKKLEQNNKLKNSGQPLIEDEWTRWELELKDDRAINAGILLEKGDVLGEVVVGILSHYLRLIVLDDVRRTRCSTLPLWDAFLNGVRPLSIASSFVPKTIESKKVWISRQVAPSMAAIVLAEGGDMGFIYQSIEDGADRMNEATRRMVRAYQNYI